MKKLLILMLVLGLTSAANAAIIGVSLRVAGPYSNPAYIPVQADYQDVTDITIVPSDYIWIGVYNPTKGTPGTNQQKDNFFLGTVEPSPDTAWTGAGMMYDGPLGNNGVDGISPGLGEPLVDGCPPNEYYDVLDFGPPAGILDVWYLQLTDGIPGTANDMGVLDAKQLHCEIEPSVDVVELWDGNAAILFDSVNVHQIPEPMTVLLLGLGGLLLRRRK